MKVVKKELLTDSKWETASVELQVELFC
jgi:hypothetical protein